MSRLLKGAARASLALVLILIPTSPPRVSVPRHERSPSVTIAGATGVPVRLAVARFDGDLPVGSGDEAPRAADVLRQDLTFEGAFALLDGGHLGSAAAGRPDLPPATRLQARQLGADGLLTGSVRPVGDRVEIDVRIYKVSTGEQAFARGYLAKAEHLRLAAHTAADEVHQALAGVRGTARSRLAFVSDRGGLRRELGGMMRHFKEVWIADYDGANQRRVTFDGDLDMTPAWSPDGRAIAYTSMRRGPQDIFVSGVDEHRAGNPTHGVGTNRLPAWSPDGTRIAFSSGRDGNEEIYVANADGSGARRLTRHWAIDTAPAWSPDGRQIAFTSGRSGSPQIWVMNADGSNPHAVTAEKYCDRPSWAPPPYNEIAYVSKTKTGFDIKVLDVDTGATRQLTFGHGFNESPAFSPNGRHIAFCSTRQGGQQIWIISRTGEGLRQVTTIGNNTMPAWSK